MTAPDKLWIADPYLSAIDGSIQAGTYSPCSDWHFKHEYTRTDLPNALIAAAYEAAAKIAQDGADYWKETAETARANKNPKESRDWQSMMLAGLFIKMPSAPYPPNPKPTRCKP